MECTSLITLTITSPPIIYHGHQNEPNMRKLRNDRLNCNPHGAMEGEKGMPYLSRIQSSTKQWKAMRGKNWAQVRQSPAASLKAISICCSSLQLTLKQNWHSASDVVFFSSFLGSACIASPGSIHSRGRSLVQVLVPEWFPNGATNSFLGQFQISKTVQVENFTSPPPCPSRHSLHPNQGPHVR